MKQYTVGIPKAYFPKEIQPKGIAEECFDVVKIRANSRTDAAHIAWEKYGDRWLSNMSPRSTKLPRRISLFVDEPNSVSNGTLTRLTPISLGIIKEGTVIQEATTKDMAVVRDLIVDVIKGTKFENHTFVAGGFVRDKLLGRESKDLDIAVDLPSGGEELSQLIGKKIGKVPIIHRNFGTAQLTLDGMKYGGHIFGKDTVVEFVQTRTESYRGTSRKPETEYGTLEQDHARRDFSINSMYEDIVTGEILDLSGKGKSDIQNKIIRTTGDPDIIFGEDPLRILRAIRFCLKYGMEIEPETLDGIRRNALKIINISGERISGEFRKILSLPHAGDGMRILRDTKVLKAIDLRLDDAITEHVVRQLNNSNDLITSLSFLFRIPYREHGDQSVSTIMLKMKFTIKEIEATLDMLDVLSECYAVWSEDFDDQNMSAFIYKIVSNHGNLVHLSHFISEFYPEIGAEILKMKDNGLSLPISGKDVMTELGAKGKVVGEMLRYGWNYMYSNPQATKEEVINSIRNKFAGNIVRESVEMKYLSSIRSFLESKWNDGSSQKQCIRATYFLHKLLGGTIKGGWVSSNPLPNESGGFFDKSGKWNFHYWLEKDGQIIDITSDQFMEPKIIVVPSGDKRYKNKATRQDIQDDFKWTKFVVDEWIEEYRRSQ